MARKHPAAMSLLVILLAAHVGWQTATADVFDNVPEAFADDYQLVYTLPIQNTASYNSAGPVPYSVDNSANLMTPFDRIAYYLELDDGTGLQYAYASMNAFTADASKIGLPTTSTGAIFQRRVSNMNVVSNSSSVTAANGITTGNIEFWPTSYRPGNLAGIPNASQSDYDFGDSPGGTGDWGSFQIHNHGMSETVFAYNQWGGQQPMNNGDLGIGNAPTGHPDWTLSSSAGNYSIKNLQVLVRPAPVVLDVGIERAVIQRNAQNQASVPLSGSIIEGVSRVEARAIPRQGSAGRATDWQVIDAGPGGGSFAGAITLDGGWYDVEVRALDGSNVVGQSTTERVGVGEVFVIAGQSNSANFGDPTLTPEDDRVSAFDWEEWRHAVDPQPVAGGTGGSPWPALGDALAEELNVPVGFTSVGIGGTTVEEWLPGAGNNPFYNRLRDALVALGPDGARAVLWHQGETDNRRQTSTEDYVQRLETIIAESRSDAGFDVPWGIAQASFDPSARPPVGDNIIEAQRMVAENDPLNFVGPRTDDLIGDEWRWDTIHFNESGLREHAARWFDSLIASFDLPTATLFGDFSADLQLDCADVDALVAEIASGGGDLAFDLNGDSLVTADDLDLWLGTAGMLSVGYAILPGDANLDGFVDVQDFNQWNRHKFTSQSAWCAGDFNADGIVDGLDFGVWSQNKFRSSDPVATVPEPNSGLFMTAIFCCTLIRRRYAIASRSKPFVRSWQVIPTFNSDPEVAERPTPSQAGIHLGTIGLICLGSSITLQLDPCSRGRLLRPSHLQKRR